MNLNGTAEALALRSYAMLFPNSPTYRKQVTRAQMVQMLYSGVPLVSADHAGTDVHSDNTTLCNNCNVQYGET